MLWSDSNEARKAPRRNRRRRRTFFHYPIVLSNKMSLTRFPILARFDSLCSVSVWLPQLITMTTGSAAAAQTSSHFDVRYGERAFLLFRLTFTSFLNLFTFSHHKSIHFYCSSFYYARLRSERKRSDLHTDFRERIHNESLRAEALFPAWFYDQMKRT